MKTGTRQHITTGLLQYAGKMQCRTSKTVIRLNDYSLTLQWHLQGLTRQALKIH